jgi:P2X purinoceptor 4
LSFFRYAKYFRDNETEYRRLIKAYGVKYILTVTGQAGKFNLVPLLTNIGSGMALLGVVSITTVIHLGTCLRTFAHLFLKMS